MSGEQDASEAIQKPYFLCEDCGHKEPVPIGEQFLNPTLQSCENCGESGLEMVR